jgi:FdrA protein
VTGSERREERVAERVIVRRGSYHDSARLMRIGRELSAVAGITSADVIMGTAANIEMLAQAGFPRADLQGATPMDMVVALRSDDRETFAAAEQRLATLLAGATSEPKTADRERRPGSVAEAVRSHPGANLVSIAVPGAYAAFVANRALDAGRNVFLFSDNVALEDEVALKTRGCASGLLVMGPDCGTAIVAGVGLGFANRVPRGHVGIVGASGTGTQEVCCLLSRLGVGVSHAIGTGSRDLSTAVNGMMSEFALRLLAEDAATRVVVLVAKHPAPEVADRLHGVLAGLGKPAVVRYLGEPARVAADGVVYAETLDEAAAVAAAVSGRATLHPGRATLQGCRVSGRLVGLFGGGSLAAEAQYVLATCGIDTTVPARPLVPGQAIPGPPTLASVPSELRRGHAVAARRVEGAAEAGTGHLIVDTGDDAYTVGRPHPMVDQIVRCGLVRAAGADPAVGLILLDLVLGDGAHSDPAPEIAAAVADARAARPEVPLAVVCSVCGSTDDPQDVERQMAVLGAAGIHTTVTAAQAALLSAGLLGRSPERSAR